MSNKKQDIEDKLTRQELELKEEFLSVLYEAKDKVNGYGCGFPDYFIDYYMEIVIHIKRNYDIELDEGEISWLMKNDGELTEQEEEEWAELREYYPKKKVVTGSHDCSHSYKDGEEVPVKEE